MVAASTGRIVCVVDDDEAVRDSTQMLLGIYGFEVRAYAAARDFLDDFDAARAGCLILDIHMPEMTGVELLSLLRSRGVSTPAIIVSGQADPSLNEMLMRSGALAILNKPVNEDELMTFVHQALGSSPP